MITTLLQPWLYTIAEGDISLGEESCIDECDER